MSRPHVILVPGILAAVLFVIMATAVIANPGMAEAIASSEPGYPAAEIEQTESPGLSAGPATLLPSTKSAASNTSSVVQENNRSGQECSLPSRYPEAVRRWCSLIEIHAKKARLDPRLVAAVMLQESGGNPKAYSSSGAVGLMQVMPRDGLAAEFMCNGRPCFSSRPSMAELYDPEFNISYGVRMLAGLSGKYGNTRDALKAYGPMDRGYVYADKVLRILETYR